MAKTENLKSFPKGRSGNPGGRPKIPPEARETALALTPEAVETLGEIMRDKTASAPARVSAAVAILDRALGKPNVPITLNPKDASNLSEAELERIIARASSNGTAEPEAGAEKPGSVH